VGRGSGLGFAAVFSGKLGKTMIFTLFGYNFYRESGKTGEFYISILQ